MLLKLLKVIYLKKKATNHFFLFFFTTAIGKAFSILSDPKKREDYDQYGQAMEPQNQRSGRGGQYYYYSDEDDDFSADEIFNLFFGHSGMIYIILRKRTNKNF